MDEKVWDVAIIGSGPAALTAGIYTGRGALSTIILGGEAWGGQLMLTTAVDNYPGFPEGIQGPDLMSAMKKQAEGFGVEFSPKNVTSVEFISNPFKLVTESRQLTAKSVIIATGASTLWLDVPVLKELIGHGVSSCAPCDAPFFKNKKVAVVGGGDSAMEESLILTKYANEVTIIHRRDAFRASAIMQEKVISNPKIKILWNTEVIRVSGEGKLENLGLKNNKTSEESEFPVDGLFIAIGHKPESDIFKGKLDIDEKGYVKKIPNLKFQMSTSVDGVFVAGDVHDFHYKQAITAAGFGCMAALDTIAFLEENK